jgi:hypothetical protein
MSRVSAANEGQIYDIVLKPVYYILVPLSRSEFMKILIILPMQELLKQRDKK